MIIDYLTVGRKIKSLRQSNGLSQAELAEIVEVSTPYISNLESGTKFISVETLIRVSNALGTTPDYLLSEFLITKMSAAGVEFTILLEDCNSYERRMILDNAKHLKTELRDNYYLLHNNQ